MCTLSWLPRPGGFLLYFNRDERRSRAPGTPPSIRDQAGVAVLAPTDGDFGGTWIGVNEFGVAAALLNRYEGLPDEPLPGRVSRGLLLVSALAAPSARALVNRLGSAQLPDFLPFTVCAVDPASPILVADWTGARLEETQATQPGLVRTSSGSDQPRAEEARRRALEALVGGNPLTPPVLDQLHRSHVPERGPLSVCMHRPEAETQSLTIVEVGPDRATVTYVPGSPCLGHPAQSSVLRLVPPQR